MRFFSSQSINTTKNDLLLMKKEGIYHMLEEKIPFIKKLLDVITEEEHLQHWEGKKKWPQEPYKSASLRTFYDLLEDLHPSEISYILRQLDSYYRQRFVYYLKNRFNPKIFLSLVSNANLLAIMVSYFSIEEIIDIVRILNNDDVVFLLQALQPQKRQEILKSLQEDRQKILKERLSYGKDTAGYLMQQEIIILQEEWSLQEAVNFLRNQKKLPRRVGELFVVNKDKILVGKISLSLIFKEFSEKKTLDVLWDSADSPLDSPIDSAVDKNIEKLWPISEKNAEKKPHKKDIEDRENKIIHNILEEKDFLHRNSHALRGDETLATKNDNMAIPDNGLWLNPLEDKISEEAHNAHNHFGDLLKNTEHLQESSNVHEGLTAEQLESKSKIFKDILKNNLQNNLHDHIPEEDKRKTIADLMDHVFHPILLNSSHEEIAINFQLYNLICAPIINEEGVLLGMITADDVIDMIEREAGEDLLHMGRIHHADFSESIIKTSFNRIHWLILTLLNTLLTALVIDSFHETLGAKIALTALMPVAAAMGGNTGIQASTVVIRGLATKELTKSNFFSALIKEVSVGFLNGNLLASLMAFGTYFWMKDLSLSFVLFGAVLFNMLWAGFVGTFLPISISRLNFDPALSTGPLLTITTDVLGYGVFLTLARIFLH